ncbi:MAG: HD-GYP domain-containing protein [Deferribacteres bacterium]|nr:HD-GYP domain-containing protein [Deferribacteres bacterium]
MIKKIKIEQLKPGMYVHDFNYPWLKHPFLGTTTKVKDEKTIEKIAGCGIRELYIDTDKGLDADAPTEQEVSRDIQAKLDRIGQGRQERKYIVPLRHEIAKAEAIKKEARQTVRSIMEEARFGRRITTERVEPVVEKMIESILRNQDALICLGRIKEADEYTYMHSMSVCVLMLSFGRYLGFNDRQLKEVGIGAMLHDVGKMKVPLKILNSRRPLSDREFSQIKRHVEYSNVLLEETGGIAETSVILASEHHERVDGTGYPHGLKGEQISFYGQAAAIADVYDAMTSKRCYQRRYEPTEVLKKLYEWSGHYNPELVQHFIRCIGIYPVGSLVRLESGLLAVVIQHSEKDLLHPVVRVIYDTKRDKFVLTYDIDLSQPGKGGPDRIVCSESSDKWRIRTERYL